MTGAPPTTARGLTIMEMLVVLTLVSLLGTLLVQGLGFFVARYDAMKRHHRAADQGAAYQLWFQSTVGGIVPVGVRARALRGDASSFAGTSLQPLAGEAGVPARVRWTVQGRSGLAYEEQGAATGSAGPVAWRLPRPAAATPAFQYADRSGGWHDAWPTAAAPREWTPARIRLVENAASAAPRVVWIARVAAAPYPLPNEYQLP